MTAKQPEMTPEIVLVSPDTHQISCNGGGVLGHPKVYYSFDGQDKVICWYCDRVYSKKKTGE